MKNHGRNKVDPSLDRVVLVSAPWPLFNRPSIQLGALKPYLQLQYPEQKVEAHHLYLMVAERIGYKRYQAVAEKIWLSESLYAALLYPERVEKLERLFRRKAVGHPVLGRTDFQELTRDLREVTDDVFNSTDWNAVGLMGFSICVGQLTSSLYFIRRIKQKHPDIPVVIGGSAFMGSRSRGLLTEFPEIDFMVIGEGERPLAGLVNHLARPDNPDDLGSIPGVVTRETPGNGDRSGMWQIEELDDLPPPDFDDYFHLLKTLGPDSAFFPVLPVEISRGCWWQRGSGDGRESGCAFCNLNHQWAGYRAKSPEVIVSEIDRLTSRHKLLSISFTDNLLPQKGAEDIFSGISRLDKDFSLFGEIRAVTPKRILRAMHGAGMREVQIGIEALSTRLLKTLNKGTTTIQNLEIMKDCEELGLINASNLIIRFPGTGADDVAETLRAIAFALPFRPLKVVRFWLGLGSPVWRTPRDYGLKAVFNHRNYAAVFPPEISGAVRFIIQDYRGGKVLQRSLWRPVKRAVRDWEKSYRELRWGSSNEPILGYRDGGTFMIVRQRRYGAEPLTHRLQGTSREIYLFCRTHRSFKRIFERFPRLGEDRIRPFLRMMVDKKLMFEEGDKYLSLAVRLGRM